MHVVNGTVLMVLMGGVPGCSHDVEWGKRRQDGLIDFISRSSFPCMGELVRQGVAHGVVCGHAVWSGWGSMR